MPELLHIPNGQVLITNGAATVFAAIAQVPDPAEPAVISIKVTTETEGDGSVTTADGKDLSLVEEMD